MLKRFGLDAITYTIPVVAGRTVGLITLPIFTRYLTPEQFGILAMLTVAFTLLNIVAPMEIAQGMGRSLADREGVEAYSRVMSTAFWFRLFAVGGLGLGIVALPQTVSRIVLGSAELGELMPVFALYFVVGSMASHMTVALHWTLQPAAAALAGCCRAVGILGVGIPLVVFLDLRVEGVLYGQIVGAALTVVVAMIAVQRAAPLGLSVDRAALREMLEFSGPLVFSGIGVYLSLYIDRWCISWLLALEEVGPYSVAFTVAAVVKLVTIGFQTALPPLVYEHHREPQTPRFISRALDWYVLLTAAMVALITAANPLLFDLVIGSEFRAGQICTPWITLGLVLMNVHLFAPGLSLKRQTWHFAGINLLAAAVNVLGNVILLPRFGIVGAAIATVLTGLVMAVPFTIASQRRYPLPLRTGRHVAVLTALTIGIGTCQWWSLGWTRWALMGSLVVLACGLFLPDLLRGDGEEGASPSPGSSSAARSADRSGSSSSDRITR